MARQHEIVTEIMTGECVQILNGKKFGTLLGELLKMIKMVEADLLDAKGVATAQRRSIKTLMIALEQRTPDGLKSKLLKVAELVDESLSIGGKRQSLGEMLAEQDDGVTVVKI